MKLKQREFFQKGTLSTRSKIIDRPVIPQVIVGLILVLFFRHKTNGQNYKPMKA